MVGYLAEAAQLRMPVAWPQLLATCNVDAPCCAQVRAYVCLCTRAETTSDYACGTRPHADGAPSNGSVWGSLGFCMSCTERLSHRLSWALMCWAAAAGGGVDAGPVRHHRATHRRLDLDLVIDPAAAA